MVHLHYRAKRLKYNTHNYGTSETPEAHSIHCVLQQKMKITWTMTYYICAFMQSNNVINILLELQVIIITFFHLLEAPGADDYGEEEDSD